MSDARTYSVRDSSSCAIGIPATVMKPSPAASIRRITSSGESLLMMAFTSPRRHIQHGIDREGYDQSTIRDVPFAAMLVSSDPKPQRGTSSMLAITQTAVDAIDAIVASAPVSDTAGGRLSEQVSEDGQPGLAIARVEQPQPSDQVLEPDGEHTPVFIDEGAAQTLDDKVLDAQAQNGQVGFVIAEQP